MGNEEVTLAEAEHACSTPKSKWRGQHERCAESFDAPDGVMGELASELEGRPVIRSGLTGQPQIPSGCQRFGCNSKETFEAKSI